MEKKREWRKVLTLCFCVIIKSESMSTDIKSLEPRSLWAHFSDLNAVPRPSKREERVIAFMRAFGESLGLPTTVDAVGNVIIKKPATAGMEGRQSVALQSHLDLRAGPLSHGSSPASWCRRAFPRVGARALARAR